MPILKPKDDTYVCPASGADLDDLLRNMLTAFNGIRFIETDGAGAHLPNADPYEFFAVNRVLAFRPVTTSSLRTNNRYNQLVYECLLTIARPVGDDLEIETINVPGQFDTITKEFTSLGFINTLKSYFTCCDYPAEIIRVIPIWNSNKAVAAVNHSGVEIYLNVTI